MLTYKLHINGELRDASDSGTFAAVYPYDRSVAGKIARATALDTCEAVAAAKNAF